MQPSFFSTNYLPKKFELNNYNKLIKNRGAFKINKLIVRTFKDGKVSTNDMNGVGVKEEIDTTLIFGGSERIEIIPIILDDKKNEEIA